MLSVRSPQSATPARVARRRSRLAIVVTAVVASCTLAACGGATTTESTTKLSDRTGPAGNAAWQKVVKEAKAEGQVVFYTAHAEDTMNQLATAFQKQYGIKVKIFRAADTDLEPKLNAEAKTGNHVADLVGLSDQDYIKQTAAQGAYAAPEGPALSASGFDRAANALTPHVLRSVATTMSYAWNTDLHPQGLKGFPDLLDPSLSGGKIGVLAPFTPAVMDFYAYLQKHYGADYLQKLAAQKPRIYQAGAAMAAALASGEIAAATQVSQVALYTAKDAGAPVNSGLAHPAWGAAIYDAVLAHAPHPAAAQLLMNYIFTPAGQEIVAHRTAAVLPNIPGAATTVDKTTTGGAMTASPAQFKSFVAKFNQLFH
jgi:iron(III) transport system substrate-binding protein